MTEDERIKKLEARVTTLENEIVALKREKKVMILKDEKKLIHSPKLTRPDSQETSTPPKSTIDWEKKIGQVWLPRVFIFVLLLGVIWGFKAGTELGLINDFVRIAAGYAAGFLLLFVGRKQWQKQNLVLSQVLLGGAVAIFFLTTFAAHILYHLISTPIAFSLHIIIVTLGFLLTRKFQSQTIGIVSSVGAFLVPFLLQSDSGNILFFSIYELLVFIVFMMLALSSKLKSLYLVVTYGLHLSFLIFALIQWNEDIRTLALVTLVQHLMIILYFLYRQTLKEQVAFTVLTSSVLMSFWILATFTSSFWLLVVTVSYILIVAFIKMELDKRSVFLSNTALVLLLFLIDHFEQSALGIFLVIEGSLVVYLSFLFHSKLQRWIGFSIFALGAFSILVFPIEQFPSIETLAWTILMVCFLLQIKFNQTLRHKKDLFTVVKTVMAFLGLLYFSQLSLLITNDAKVESMVLSTTWILYAAANVIYGHINRDKLFRLFGIFLIFFTLLKVVFIDLPTVSILIRAILFLLLGGIGLAVSRLFYKKETHDRMEEGQKKN
ncbi:DUF2339 domain-containing protein [Halalkalibacter alkalisediminis]|uniref:DUF2339 domain-containing protein n=1 Tax=Halalkalibacter alkalisediminis TaxID=935616 RepID=A0ABV6NLP1_9BACI|nr:DUF2339 domain-containing protein [Halalkalibacter alkalisediminis]